MSDLNYVKMIILVPGVVFNHSVKTYRDVTRKADTWKAIGTKLIVLSNIMFWKEINFSIKFAIEN